ncbi:UNVERIFIED_CONTAM: excinuclease ABC subunit A, partial [Mumia flava]
AIARHLNTLVDVGLGYVRLGQPAPTLSGGEAQRVKLAAELQKRQTGRTLYVLDEPTTGLHFEDIRKLLGVLGRLVDQGNSVIVIEHNLDVIKTADWIVDMGPEGGTRGGLLIAEGTPEQVAADPDSHTGSFLRPLLEGKEAAQPTMQPALDLEPGAGRRTTKKAAAKKTAAKRPAKKTAAVKGSTATATTKKSTAKKAPAKKSTAKKAPAKKSTAKRSTAR